ncbi:hypothetical protein EPUS_06383 [Endocarpon pusillum Z07020]|uniref:Aminoglycoside phosphotransferase domain-containing protein n=1 Tax=Endocarpon pusillum (strain Z07020 / HMAS-L-300199) TaxID=1263415 RepID=U1HXF5_ENDPU|nr:uncharacterized protein EPUS_06383 [Endocarpon pusillum Z07020]ERF74114.1 hypothetical protein EPUS_06383 [Endocarpon pusillum Z07020]
MIRFPLPYQVGEAFRPGNADEKLRCEAGAYVWLQENCPALRIPFLYGFGLSTGQRFTALENLPLASRCLGYLLRRLPKWLGYSWLSRYVRHQGPDEVLGGLRTGYLLLDNLIFRIDDDGSLTLQNRPLSLEIQDLENEEIPVDMPRDFTYSTVDSYVADILAFHDGRLRHQPNAIMDDEDGLYQMAALAIMKSLSSQFFRLDLRRGPLVFCLADLHQSNIFVDDNWNIKCLVDLEWACSRPIEMVHPPYWLTSQSVDDINLDQYTELHKEFMDAFQEEERTLDLKDSPP